MRFSRLIELYSLVTKIQRVSLEHLRLDDFPDHWMFASKHLMLSLEPIVDIVHIPNVAGDGLHVVAHVASNSKKLETGRVDLLLLTGDK